MAKQLSIKPTRPPEKLMFLYTEERLQWKYFILEGGRGGGKTESLGQFLIVNSFNDSGDILCLREVQNSIADSVYKVLEEWIEKLGLERYFKLTKTEITNKETGARFLFRGMNDPNALKSLKGVKFVWYEEAQTANKEGIDKLLPTIRIDDAQFFFTMNPDTEQDIVPQIVGKYSTCKTVKINYYDNPYCPQILIDLAEECKVLWPQEFEHIWEGRPRGDGDRQTVCTKALLHECVDAHLELGHSDGHSYGGLDMASGETRKNDKNAVTSIRGAVVLQSDEWRSNDLASIAERVKLLGMEHAWTRMYFDAVGVGGFAEKQLLSVNPAFAVEPYMGQHSTKGAEKYFIRHKGNKIYNKDYFKNLKSQQWWNLRLRAENTLRMKRGFVNLRPEYYLSISSGVNDVNGLINELSQATWMEDNSGRVLIDKSPGDYKVVIDGKKVAMRSPNRADSLIGAFSRSIRYGLKANR